MPNRKLETLFLEQSNDLIWMVDADLLLTYANQAYLTLMKQVTGKEKKLQEPIFVEGFGEGYIEKWAGYYKKALSGDYFELEEHYSHPETNEIKYGQIIFNPIRDDNHRVIAVACQSRDITRIVKQRSDAHQLMDASLDVFCTINEAGNFVFVSEAASQHWGYTPGELIGLPYVSLIIEEDIPKTNAIVDAILSGEEIKSFENRYKRKDGGFAYNQWSARWDKNARLMYCVARDAKTKIEQENLLHQSEQRFKALVQDGADMISIIGVDGRYSYTSPTTTGILGITPEEFQGRTIFDFIHPDDIERAAGYMQRISTESKVMVEPFRLRDGNNEWRWIETVLTNMLDNPIVNGIVANSRDITAKEEEEQRLKLLERVITNANDAILFTEAEPFDEPGPRILYVNEAFTRMTGYTAEEVIGKSPRMLQGPKSDMAELATLGKALRNWEPCEITVINYKKNGEEFWVNLSISPMADKNGSYTHWISIQRDVSEQKVKEREKELLTDISLNFNRENDYGNACKALCKTIGVFGDFDWVELWTINIDRSKAQYTGHYMKDPSNEVFYTETKGFNSFEKGSGLPGKVWQSKHQELWSELEPTTDFVRKKAAKKINLKMVLGLPLINQDEVVGVLLVGSKHGVETLKKYTGLFADFHSYIGSEIYRKKLENDLNHLYESIPDIVCVADFQGRFLKMNRSGCHLLGYTEEEILYHSFDEFVFPADKDISAQELAKLGKSQSVFSFENRYVQKNGEICWLSWTCNANQQEGIIYATARNITAEKKLRELNIITSKMARIGSWEVDLQKNKIFWSEMVHHLHETDPQHFKPDLAQGIEFYREDFRPLVTEAVNQCIQSGTPFDFEAVLVTANKNELWVRVIGNAELLNGACIRIYGSFQDIHERKKANAEIAKSEEKRRLIMNGALDAIITIDTNETITFWNAQAEVIFGWKAEEVMGKPLSEMIIPEPFRKYHVEGLKNYLKTGERKALNVLVELSAIRRNGEEFPIELTVIPIKQGGEEFFCAFIRDITQRKNSESKLIENENYLRTILDNEPECVKVLNSKGELLSMNPAGLAMIEADNEQQVLGHRMTDLVNKEYQLGFNRLSKEVFKGNAGSFEFEITGLKGGCRWLETHAVPLKDTTGKIVNLLGVTRDITEQKKAEEKLLNAFNEKTRILERITEAFVSLDNNWCYTYMNKQAGEIFNRDPEKMIGKHIWTEFPEGLNQPFHLAYEKAMATQQYIHVEEHYKPYDLWFENHIYPSAEGLSIFFRDISERKRNEEQLRQSNERFEKVTDATNDAIWDFDAISNQLFWGKGFYTLFGYNEEETKPSFDLLVSLIHEQDRERVTNKVYQYMVDPNLNNWFEEYRFLKADGSFAFVIDRATFLRNSQGKVLRIVGAMTDITYRKEYEESLRKLNASLDLRAKQLAVSNAELEQFAYIASHDLQEPLRMVTSFLTQVDRRYSSVLDDRGKQYIHFAVDGAKRMRQIILDLLEYSRIGRAGSNPEQINLNELIEEIRFLFKRQIEEKDASISSDLLPVLMSHRSPLRQLFQNLIGNALKYSYENRPVQIHISVNETDSQFEFCVKDNGIGIDPEYFEKIFIIFQRLHNKDEYSGTGMGLSISKKIVESLGGKIWVQSIEGEGSSFFFTIMKSIVR